MNSKKVCIQAVAVKSYAKTNPFLMMSPSCSGGFEFLTYTRITMIQVEWCQRKSLVITTDDDDDYYYYYYYYYDYDNDDGDNDDCHNDDE